MPDFSVVIPTFNRLKTLKLVLLALEAQNDPPLFELVISDDGSTDGTREFFQIYSTNYSFPITYQWCGPNLGFRTSRTRNIGMAQAKGKWAILLDSEVLLNPNALREHARVREAHPDIVLIGMYHFAEDADITEEQVLNDFAAVDKLVPDEITKGPPIPGLDARVNGFHDTFIKENIITQYDGLGYWSGNISWPVDLWWRIGGQDEMMPTGMGEDAELGQRMRYGEAYLKLLAEGLPSYSAIKLCIPERDAGKLQGLPVLQYAPIYGVHLWHDRDAQWRQAAVQKSIKYIDMLHGIGTYERITNPDTDPREKNLSLWYTKDSGAELVKNADDPTVYAISKMHKGYVGIPSPVWISQLDFVPSDIKTVDNDYFTGLSYHGVIQK